MIVFNQEIDDNYKLNFKVKMLKQSPLVLALFFGASNAIHQQASDNFDTDVAHRGNNYIHDPNTVAMYDDMSVYTNKPGSLNWKFPQPKQDKKSEEKPASLVQLNSNPEGFSDPPAIVIPSTGVSPLAAVDAVKPIPTYAIPDPIVVPEVIVQLRNLTNPAGFSDPPPIVIKPTGVSPYERSGISKQKPIPKWAEPPLL